MKATQALVHRTLLLVLLVIMSSLGAFANEVTAIKGQVSTSDGQPAAHVSVTIKNTNQGTFTDQNGEFSIKRVKPGHYTLQVTLIGFAPVEQEVDVESGKICYVSLKLTATHTQMQEVVVDAAKNSFKANAPSNSLRLQEPLIEVPQNIQVVTKEVLNDQQAFDMQESVTRNVSGAQRIAHWDTYARINMRGGVLTPFRNGMNAYISPWSPLTEDMSMVDRIEFVKGPAGFMLSNGEPGGFYNVVTKKPTGQTKTELGFTIGDYDTYRATADVDGKLSKNGKLLYRLNVMGQMAGSHLDYAYNNRYSIVPVLKYLIDDKTSVTLEYTHQYAQLNVIGGNYAFSKHGYGDLPRNFTTAQPNFDPTVVHDQSLLAVFEHQFNAQWKITAQGAYFHFKQKGQSMWPSGFSTTNDSLLQRAINNWDAFSVNKTGQVFINGTVNTGVVQHKLLGGLDMKHSDYFADWNQWSLLGAPINIYKPDYTGVTLPVYDRSQDIRQRGVEYNYGYKALYIQDELGFLNNTLRLTLGGRYTKNMTYTVYEGSTSNEKFTPRAGVSYSIDKNTSAYALYDQYFIQNPGTDWQGKSFDPLTGQNIEFGIKRDWFNGKWNSTVAVYKTNKQNVLVDDNNHPNPAGGFYSRQSGEQEIQGVEVDIRGSIIPNLAVVINYAYTDATITKDTDPKFVGNTVPGTSRHLQNSWLSYRFKGGVLNGFKLAAGYQYQVKRVAGLVYDKNVYPLPDYFRLDGSIGYAADKFDINLNVNNLLNKYLYAGGVSGGYYYWQTEPGMNFRVSVGYRF